MSAEHGGSALVTVEGTDLAGNKCIGNRNIQFKIKEFESLKAFYAAFILSAS